jgi:hypothetical protein
MFKKTVEALSYIKNQEGEIKMSDKEIVRKKVESYTSWIKNLQDNLLDAEDMERFVELGIIDKDFAEDLDEEDSEFSYYTCNEDIARLLINDSLDVEVKLSMNRFFDAARNGRGYKDINSCLLTLGIGGPNVYIDTESCRLIVNWGFTRDSDPICRELCEAIDAQIEESFNCI